MTAARCTTIARLCMLVALTFGLLGFLSSAHAEGLRRDIPELESPYAPARYGGSGFIPPGVLAALERFGGMRAVRMAQRFVPRGRHGVSFCPSVRVTRDRHGAFFALAGRF